MKNSILAAVVIAVLRAGIALAQEKPSGQQDARTSSGSSAKTLTVSGKVSSDGTTLMTDIDSVWDVSNTDALKGHEGHRVTVKCYVDTDHNQIRVLSVRKDESEIKFAARLDDSAFRR
jgi:hypothetical protein